MLMQRIIFPALTLALFSSCNPGHTIDQGRTLTGEAQQTADAAVDQASPPGIENPDTEPQIVISDETPKAPEALPPAPTPAPTAPTQTEADDEDNNNKTAMEPVPIGGAYLTCRYQNGQTQGSETYRMDCEVAPLKEVTVPIVSAAFYKLDAQGNRSPLKVVVEDLLALKWTVQESPVTMLHSQVQIVLGVPGFLATSLTTKINPTFQLIQNPVYWLGGEPNNLNFDEDCVEFMPANGKISHQNFSGLSSGPLGRMNDIACTLSYNFLCRNISAGATAAKWTVSANAGPFADGALACSQGYGFGFPLNDAEVREVISLVDRLDMRVWVNMSDRVNEGIFSMQFR